MIRRELELRLLEKNLKRKVEGVVKYNLEQAKANQDYSNLRERIQASVKLQTASFGDTYFSKNSTNKVDSEYDYCPDCPNPGMTAAAGYYTGDSYLSRDGNKYLYLGDDFGWSSSPEVILSPTEIYLSFDAERSAGRSRIDGTLSIIRKWPNQDEFEIGSFSALSGSSSLLPIPNADDWQLRNFSVRDERGNRINNRMMREGHGFSIDITPDPRWGRSLLRIHPDGGYTGTQGCIGLTGGYDELVKFENTMRNLLSFYSSIRLQVNGSYNGPDGGWIDNTNPDLNEQVEVDN